jgi:acyl-CoA thioesterase FadM
LGWGGPKFLIAIQKHLDDEYHTPEAQQQTARRVVVVVRSGQLVFYSPQTGMPATNAGPAQIPYLTNLKITSEVAEVRQRSLTIQHDVFAPVAGGTTINSSTNYYRVCSLFTTIVAMDALAGRAVPLPPSLVQLASKLIPETIMGTYVPITFPVDIQSGNSPYRVGHEWRSAPFSVGVSCTDPLGHVNQSRYADWYEDYHYALCYGSPSPEPHNATHRGGGSEAASASPSALPAEYLNIAKDTLFHSGRVIRIEYMQETLPAEWISIRVRWIFLGDAFYGLWWDTLAADTGIVKNQMLVVFHNRTQTSSLSAGPPPPPLSKL